MAFGKIPDGEDTHEHTADDIDGDGRKREALDGARIQKSFASRLPGWGYRGGDATAPAEQFRDGRRGGKSCPTYPSRAVTWCRHETRVAS